MLKFTRSVMLTGCVVFASFSLSASSTAFGPGGSMPSPIRGKGFVETAFGPGGSMPSPIRGKGFVETAFGPSGSMPSPIRGKGLVA